jgi:hypothetical protein
MSSTDQANAPIIRDFRTLAVKWKDWQKLKIILIFIEMRIVVQF